MVSIFHSVVFSLLITIQIIQSIDNPCANNGQSCTPLTRAEKEQLLDIHNELRDRVASGALINEGHPAATNMNQLLWDEGLEAVAQRYAESCPTIHNPNRGQWYMAERDAGNVKWGPDTAYFSNFCSGEDCIYVGENLAWTSAGYSIDSMISHIEGGWWDEYRDWTFGNHNNGCPAGKQCGHYTQMAWANTRYIGCGYSNGCGQWHGTLVCNYWPAGNFNSVPPYSSGTKCSDCMFDRTSCESSYSSVSPTAGLYPSDPFNALCGGGVCKTMCDGVSYSEATCDGNGCNGSDRSIDCNDGTRSLNRGRDICGTPTPTAPSSVVTPSPIPVGGNYCCTNVKTSNKWVNGCPTNTNEADCSAAGRGTACEWVDCDTIPAPGSCVWNGQGNRNRDGPCGKKKTQSGCESRLFNGVPGCVWQTLQREVGDAPQIGINGATLIRRNDDGIFELNASNVGYLQNYYNNISVQGIISLFAVIIIIGFMIYCIRKFRGNQKTKRIVNDEGYGATNNI